MLSVPVSLTVIAAILNTCYWEDLSRFILKASLPDQPLRKACLRAWENKETSRT